MLTSSTGETLTTNTNAMKKNKLIEMSYQTLVRREIKQFFTINESKNLLSYGIGRLWSSFDVCYDTNKGLRGVMLEDIIQDLIFSFLEGRRNWNQMRYPSFRDQFYSAFDSAISNWIHSELAKANNHFEILDHDAKLQDDDSDYEESLKIIKNILLSEGITSEEFQIFESYMVHGMKRQDIAELIGVPVSTITNWQKKIKRKLTIIAATINH